MLGELKENKTSTNSESLIHHLAFQPAVAFLSGCVSGEYALPVQPLRP